MGFALPDEDGRTWYFQFVALPFGLAYATHIFTKVLHEFIRVWRAQGLQTIVYVDDSIDAEGTYNEAYAAAELIHYDLVQAGWIPHATKCCWELTQVLPWLGNTWDLVQFVVFANQDRVARVTQLLGQLDTQTAIVARQLAKVTGSLVSMELAYGDLVHLQTKALQMMVATCPEWDSTAEWTAQARQEVAFWLGNLQALNGISLEAADTSGTVSYSDASGVAAAAIISPSPNQLELVTNCTFSECERQQSSTFHELVAVVHGIDQTKTLFMNSMLLWKTDCSNTVHIVKRGSMRVHLHELAMKLFYITRQYRIRLNISWIPRSENERADYFSRIGSASLALCS